jgi:hypothetical protein
MESLFTLLNFILNTAELRTAEEWWKYWENRDVCPSVWSAVVQLAVGGHIRPETTFNEAREIIC